VGIGGRKVLISMASSTSSSTANNIMEGGKRVQPDLVDFVPHDPACMHAYAHLEDSTEMTFGSFRFLFGKEGSHHFLAPIFLEPLAAKSDLSRLSTTSIESRDEEASWPRYIKLADGGALEYLFGGMTFVSLTETNLSQESNSESFTSFDSAYTNNSVDNKVFTDSSDGVTYPEYDGSTTYHHICVITGSGREADEESEAFNDLGNPYIDPADLTHGTGGKYIGPEPQEKVRLP
jgi:hypothetical protein